MSVENEIENGELIAILIGIGVIGYFAYSLYKSSGLKDGLAKIADTIGVRINSIGATANTPAAFVASGQALTAQQARGIAIAIGLEAHGGSYTQSPDGMQVWFSDGTYYDNTDGNFYSKAGVAIGNLKNQIKSCGQCCSTEACLCDCLVFTPGVVVG